MTLSETLIQSTAAAIDSMVSPLQIASGLFLRLVIIFLSSKSDPALKELRLRAFLLWVPDLGTKRHRDGGDIYRQHLDTLRVVNIKRFKCEA